MNIYFYLRPKLFSSLQFIIRLYVYTIEQQDTKDCLAPQIIDIILSGMSVVVELVRDNLNEYMSDENLLVVFGTKWCTHCVDLKPILKNLSDVMTIIFVDIEKCPRSKRLYPRPMDGYPTIAVFNNGYFVEEIEGNIVDWFNDNLLKD